MKDDKWKYRWQNKKMVCIDVEVGKWCKWVYLPRNASLTMKKTKRLGMWKNNRFLISITCLKLTRTIIMNDIRISSCFGDTNKTIDLMLRRLQ